MALVVVSAAGFVIGFYAGFFALLSTVGFDRFEGWHFVTATLPLGGLLAALGAMAVTSRSLAVAVTGLLVAVAVAAVVELTNGDFGSAFGVGGPIVVASVCVAAAVTYQRP